MQGITTASLHISDGLLCDACGYKTHRNSSPLSEVIRHFNMIYASPSSCMCCFCVFGWDCVPVYMCTNLRKPEDNIGYLLNYFLTLLFEKGFLTEHGSQGLSNTGIPNSSLFSWLFLRSQGSEPKQPCLRGTCSDHRDTSLSPLTFSFLFLVFQPGFHCVAMAVL